MTKRITLYLIFSALVGAAFTSLAGKINDLPALFLAIAMLSGTIMGFTVTNLAIFSVIGNAPIINNLKKTGHFMNIVQNICLTAAGFLAAMLASLCALLGANHFIHWLTAFLFVFALLNFISTAIKFYKVAQLLGQPKGNPNILE